MRSGIVRRTMPPYRRRHLSSRSSISLSVEAYMSCNPWSLIHIYVYISALLFFHTTLIHNAGLPIRGKHLGRFAKDP